MRQQTYISYIEDENGRMLDFNRWGYKKPETVMRKSLEAYTDRFWGDFWRDQFPTAARIAIYATPDGYNKERVPVLVEPWPYSAGTDNSEKGAA